MKERLYLLSAVFLLLIFVSSLLYSLHLRGRVKELERRLSGLPAYTRSPGLSENSDLIESSLPREYRQALEGFINNNIEEIVTEEHITGGRWIVTDLKFLSPSQIQIDYEDGHKAGQLVFAIDELKIAEVKYRVSLR